ncbi:echinolectin 1-like [Diadema antillarum]|uniref:echinolectin 1-like n=1 Tax=Diadema antillarum TaxID=105358 RepID=UPI003A84B6BE
MASTVNKCLFVVIGLVVILLPFIHGQVDADHAHDGCSSYLGSPDNPALSCQHILNVGYKPSGYYFITAAGVYTKVYCEMDLNGGGWVRYGKSGMGSVWHYVDENEAEVDLEIIPPSSIKQMIELKFTEFFVQTDVFFQMVGDDSVNPSSLTTRTIPWLEERKVYIDGYANDHTRLQFQSNSVEIMTCIPGSTSKCGQGGTPSANGESKPFFFESLYFGPRAAGAELSSTLAGQWHRNKYSWNGTYYFVYARN